MRRKLIAGNWKMNGSLAANVALLAGIKSALSQQPTCDIAVCVPAPYFAQCRSELAGSTIVWGGQDISEHESGAYTGEVSAAMLRDFDCRFVIVGQQIDKVLAAIDATDMANIVVAYEPVWAIGTGKTATPHMAQEVHAMLRARLARKNSAAAAQVKILYGGSMKPDNAKELLSMEDIDGGLIGGAALKAADFLTIIRAAEINMQVQN